MKAIKAEEFDQLPKLVVDYSRYRDVVKNRSALTVREYARDLKTFFRFVVSSRGLADPKLPFEQIDISGLDIDFMKTITLNDAYSFLSYCRHDRDNSAVTRARKAVSLKRFFRYLNVQLKLLDENPLQELESPKIKKSLPKYLTLEQSLELLKAVDGNFKERDYCIITLFLNCGLRLSELVSLNLNSIRADNTMSIIGKGNKERIVYLNQASVNAIERYLAVRPVEGLKNREALFISRNMRRISNRAVENIINKFIDKAGLQGQGISVHKLRHTAATLMYQHGEVDILLIKEILGHENLSTTEIYTHLVDSQLKSAVDKNPLNRVATESKKEGE
ncbi:MAG TPA: tyrosine recombinase XerC [Oscillospiraceae bacterium]|nr:tyrosine recombinase XerC [Oscillospiraceae bacterium]